MLGVPNEFSNFGTQKKHVMITLVVQHYGGLYVTKYRC